MHQTKVENFAVLGMQWGDEGKGKVVDLLAPTFRHIVRFQGGNNAGHTVVVRGESFALHHIPSGALHPACQLIIANGVVLNLDVLMQEIEGLAARGVQILDRLWISDRAQLILPYHIALDQWREAAGGGIGTTGRGIGPAYELKAARLGLRMGALKHPDTLAEALAPIYREVQALTGQDLPSPEKLAAQLMEKAASLLGRILDSQDRLFQALEQGEAILFEGAQATLLDLDHGTYPFVTSSSCSIGGLFTGTGLPPRALHRTLGVAKAYTTRVGAGPMPTELLDETGEQIRSKGREFGTTTGRPRRCGWFDGPVTRHACRTNGLDGLALMKLDVLDGLERVGLCTGYRDGVGQLLRSLPAQSADWAWICPEIRWFEGWSASTRGVRSLDQLPKEARAYLDALQEVVECPISYLSTGPDRSEGFIWPGSFLEGRMEA